MRRGSLSPSFKNKKARWSRCCSALSLSISTRERGCVPRNAVRAVRIAAICFFLFFLMLMDRNRGVTLFHLKERILRVDPRSLEHREWSSHCSACEPGEPGHDMPKPRPDGGDLENRRDWL